MKLLILFVFFIAPIVHADLVSDKSPVMVSLTLDDYAYGMTIINSYNMDLAGVDYDKKIVDLYVTLDEIEILEDYGLFDVEKASSQMKFKNSSVSSLKLEHGYGDYGSDYSDTYTYTFTPPDEGYKTPQEVETILKEYHREFPHITKLEVIGHSIEGRNIYAMKISDNPNERELQEPTVLFNSVHHAREIMTPEVALDIVDQLVRGYSKSSRIRKWVNRSEIWVVPMVNPDGNHRVWTVNKLWRKNARGGYGVDLNRNYPYNWNTCNGSTGYTSGPTYRGSEPGSEPETQVIMNLVKRIRPVFDISYHSYSELVLYPFGCSGNKADDMVVSIGKKLGKLLDYKPGTPWELLYNADGGDVDWMYGAYQVIPYVIEVNSRSEGFQPSFERWRDITVEKNRAGWKYLLKRLFGAGLRGIAKNRDGEIISDFLITVEKRVISGYQDVMEYRGNPDGTFHLVLEPGRYRFTFKVKGRNR